MVPQSDNCWGRIEMLGVHTQCFIHSEEQNKTKQRRKKKERKIYKKNRCGYGLGTYVPKKKKKEIKIMTFLDEAEKREFPH